MRGASLPARVPKRAVCRANLQKWGQVPGCPNERFFKPTYRRGANLLIIPGARIGGFSSQLTDVRPAYNPACPNLRFFRANLPKWGQLTRTGTQMGGLSSQLTEVGPGHKPGCPNGRFFVPTYRIGASLQARVRQLTGLGPYYKPGCPNWRFFRINLHS